MRIKPEQLAASLEQRGLAPIYCICGDEPMQLLECADLIRSHARKQGVGERTVLTVDKTFDWRELAAASANLSLFSERRLIELRLDTHKPGRDGGAALAAYASAPPPDNILVLTAAKIDKQAQKSAWFQSLEARGITIMIWPVPAASLPGWILQRAALRGKTLQREAAVFIAQKVEGNLLAAVQELEKLCLLVSAPVIGLEDAMSAVNDSSRYDVFEMIRSACTGNAEHTVRMIRGLQSEGVELAGILGALLWEVRSLCSMAIALQTGATREQVYAEHRVWQQRQKAAGMVLGRLRANEFSTLLTDAHSIDQELKGMRRGNPWETMEALLLRLAGVDLRLSAGFNTL